jgi:hypothetical protein
MKQTIELTRRQFIKSSLCAAAALCLSGCLPDNKRAEKPKSYYLSEKTTIVKDFDALGKQLRKALLKNHDEVFASQTLSETRQRFINMLEDLPEIGGEGNKLISTYCLSAGALAFFLVMKEKGQPVEESGRAVYRAMEGSLAGQSPLEKAEANVSSTTYGKIFEGIALNTEKNNYPENWKAVYVPGDKKTFDYGIDYTECAVCKLFNRFGAQDFTPYLCLGDFASSKEFDTGLVRTETLARGGRRCDFRFKSGRPIQMEWTPDFIKNNN